MKIQNVMLFCYDFPHKKTQDFIFRLLTENYTISYVIASPWKKLNFSSHQAIFTPKHEGIMHPKKICQHFNIPYHVLDHSDDEVIKIIQKNPVDLYIISGARILPLSLQSATHEKLLNIHPGMLPDIRGVDTLLWSIFLDVPIGVSAHFIGKRIDGGKLIYKEPLFLQNNDTPFTIMLRLLEKQTDILSHTLNLIQNSTQPLKDLDILENQYHKCMSEKEAQTALDLFPKWLTRYSQK